MTKNLVICLMLLGLLLTINTVTYGVRDPFKSYIQKERSSSIDKDIKEGETKEEVEQKELTVEDIKKMVPFKLQGIINSGDKRRVLLDTGDNTQIINNEYIQGDFQIVKIAKDRILIRYQEFFIIMKVGGDIVEIKK